MIKTRKKPSFNQQLSQYKNIVTTEQDNQQEKSSLQNSCQKTVLAKNFNILQQFLQGFKNQNQEKQIIKFSDKAHFKEQWQNKRKQMQELKYSYFFRQNFWYYLFSIFILVIQIVLIWFLSVFRIFGYKENNTVFSMCLIIQVFDISIKSSYLLFYKFKKQNGNHFFIKKKDLVEIYLGNSYCIIYSLLGISQLISSTQVLPFLLLDLMAIIFSFYRMEDIYNDIKMIKSTSDFKNYVKLFNLMSTLIMIIHFFAVLMYLSTNFTGPHYLDEIQLLHGKTWIDFYIYSFYFSGTTILTVGYGDILPKNIIQIFIVLLMQIFGVVMIVYLNGEVGNILCSLRRQNQNLENDLSVLQRLKKSFLLSLQTTQKIKQYLIDNRRAYQENNVQQQNALLGKISLDLKEEACMTNSVNLIKQSIFLMKNFSNKVQISISHKLLHVIYSPDQKISQGLGKERLFLIKKGEISLYLSKKQNQNQNERQIIKKLFVRKNQKSECNSFGYVSLIMGKPNRLKMVATDFSSCYYVEKQSFIEAIKGDNKDYQKYYQMREGYITQRQPEKNEASLFFNEEYHYVIKISEVIEKYLNERCHQKRKNKLRNYKKTRLILELNGEDSNLDQSESENQSVLSVHINIEGPRSNQPNLNACLTQNQRKTKYKSFRQEKPQMKNNNLVVQRKYTKRYCKNTYIKKKNEQNLLSSVHNRQ